ncbi:hypothetical protein ACHAXR_007411 [Thalassiosira sp. AJA248-18]
MPVGFGVGDHRMFVLDLTIESLVGLNPVKIARSETRRLNGRLPHCGNAYIESFEGNITQHRLLERLHDAHINSSTFNEAAKKVEKIDQEGADYMRHAEKICRKIKACRIPFSEDSSIWIRRTQVYFSLIKFHQGKISNRGNLKRAARRCNIKQPLSLSLQQIAESLEYCQSQCEYFKKYGAKYRVRHLNKRVEAARLREDEDAALKILAIIKRERERAFWRRLNFVTGKKRTRSATTIQVEGENGMVSEKSTQDTVEQAIFAEVHEKRFTLAGVAPICHGQLRKDFGYLADTPSAEAVLNGTYKCHADTDLATKELFAEIARIRKEVPEASAKAVITPEQWKAYWKVQKEETSSSESGLHFGHYKVGARSDLISHYHAARVSVILAHGIALSRWS